MTDTQSTGKESEPDLAKMARSDKRDNEIHERREVISPDTAGLLIHELRLHQAELLMQNEELRRIQAELSISKARYFDLYEFAPVGYCTVSADEQVLEANQTVSTLLGIPLSALIDQPIQKFILPNDQDIYYLHRKKLLETGSSQSCEVRLMRADEAPFWAQLMASFAIGPDGSRVHRLAIADVQERKMAQERIRISDVALKAVSQGILITTLDMHILSANHAFSTMSGYSEIELMGMDCAVFQGPQPDVATVQSFENSIKEMSEFSGEVLVYRKDGSTFWNHLVVSGIRDDQGRLTNFISINTNISERKKIAQALDFKNLEQVRATTVAEKANHAKSDFLSSMSHELRSPLNSILGFAQLLESGSPSPTALQHRNIDKILKGGWYLLTLINEILDLSLIESGKLALSLKPVSLSQVLLDCQSLIEPLAEARSITLNFPRFTSPLLIIADPIRLKQVIVNLLSNAIKYNCPSGTVDVTVSSDEIQVLRISVHDTGEGLPPEKLSQLFQPFNRLGQEGSTTEGTGIGLVVSRRLTELMGGKVGVESTVGVGSVFWIELSAAQALPETKEEQSNVVGSPNQAPSEGTAYTILYVEDNLANFELVELILAGRSHLRLLRAQDGTQGIEMARNHLPDVILMDINLPGISGLEALKALRQDSATRHIPVMAISANAMPFDVVQGLAAGFFRYLTKPFKVNEFIEVLDLALVVALNKSL
jgi:PAS domain S-box-containing protein